LLPGRAKQNKPGVSAVQVHRHGPASAGADHDIWVLPVELFLSDTDCLGEVLARQLRVEDLVAVLRQVGGLHAAWDGLPVVEEEDSHGGIVALAARLDGLWRRGGGVK